MVPSRQCSKTACQRVAVATLTYVYRDSTCVLGPLSVYAEPHTYDLCGFHAERLTPPKGWELVRLDVDLHRHVPTTDPREDDLLAVMEAVRERPAAQRTAPPQQGLPSASELMDHDRRRRLWVLPDDSADEDR